MGRASARRRGAARGQHGQRRDELREFLAERVAKWQLPERWTFIAEVPKTSVGKFDKKRVRSDYAGGSLTVQTLDTCSLPGCG